LFSTENAYSDVAKYGPMARETETVVCDNPFVAPRDRLLGAAVVMNMKILPIEKAKSK
jgi:hypothetical protein